MAQKSDDVVDIDATIRNEIILSAHQTKGGESRVESRVESRIVFVNERLKAELASKGLGVRVLASLAGHKNISVTQRYIDVNDDTKRRAVGLA